MKRTNLFFLMVLISGVLFISCNQQTKMQEATANETPSTLVEYVNYPDDALKIVATVKLKNADFQADFEKALKAVVEGTNTEEGNLAYEAHQDINNPLVYVIFEVWKSQEAINFHNETLHFKTFAAALGDKAELNVNIMKKLF